MWRDSELIGTETTSNAWVAVQLETFNSLPDVVIWGSYDYNEYHELWVVSDSEYIQVQCISLPAQLKCGLKLKEHTNVVAKLVF